jgi:hypothetical protein
VPEQAPEPVAAAAAEPTADQVDPEPAPSRPAPPPAQPRPVPAPAQPRPVPAPATPGPADAGPPAEGERRDRKALVALAVVALIAVAVVVYLVNRGERGAPSAGSTTTTEAAAQPTSDTAAANPPAQTSAEDQPTTTTTTTQPEPTTTTSAPPPVEIGPDQALSDYYGLLPGNLETAYGRLTDRFKAARSPSFGDYQAWWGQMSAVNVSNVRAVGPEQVAATVSYTFKSGGTQSEQHVYTLVKVGGQWAIDAQSGA